MENEYDCEYTKETLRWRFPSSPRGQNFGQLYGTEKCSNAYVNPTTTNRKLGGTMNPKLLMRSNGHSQAMEATNEPMDYDSHADQYRALCGPGTLPENQVGVTTNRFQNSMMTDLLARPYLTSTGAIKPVTTKVTTVSTLISTMRYMRTMRTMQDFSKPSCPIQVFQ